MRFISIEEKQSTYKHFVNADKITCVYANLKGDVMIKLQCGTIVPSKFTDVSHAIDYIQRARSYSFKGGE